MIELAKYLPFLSEEDKTFQSGIFNIENFTTLKDYFECIEENWDLILSIKPPSIYLAIFSYVLMVYFDFRKLKELYDNYPSVEVSSSYLFILTRQSQKSQIGNICESFSKVGLSQTNLVSKIDCLIWQGYYYTYERNFERAELKIKKAEELTETLKGKEEYFIPYLIEKALIYYIKTVYHQIERDAHSALNECIRGIELLEKENLIDSYVLGNLYNSYGTTLNILGSPETRKTYQKGLELFSKENIERGIAICQANIARLLIQEGRYDKAIKYFFSLIELWEKFQDQRNVLITYNQIYACLKSVERMEEAERYLMKSLEDMKKYKIENDDIYLDAAEFYAIIGRFEEAEKNLQLYYELTKVKEGTEKVSAATWHISKGFIELKKTNLFVSEKELNEGIKLARKNNFGPLILQGLVYLIELLIIKYRTSDDPQTKNSLIAELELNCQECVILLREYRSIFQMVNYNLLLSTVYILSFKYELAQDVLTRTINICKEYNLQKQLERAEKNLQLTLDFKRTSAEIELQQQIRQLRSEFEMSMKMDAERGAKETTYLSPSPEEPNLLYLLVILPSGLPVYSYNFSSERISDDELLIAGLINAIQNFSSEISMEKGVFRMLEHTDYLVLLEPRENLTIALFTDSFTYEIKEGIIQFADEAEKSIDILGQKDFVKSEKIIDIIAKLDRYVEYLFQGTNQVS